MTDEEIVADKEAKLEDELIATNAAIDAMTVEMSRLRERLTDKQAAIALHRSESAKLLNELTTIEESRIVSSGISLEDSFNCIIGARGIEYSCFSKRLRENIKEINNGIDRLPQNKGKIWTKSTIGLRFCDAHDRSPISLPGKLKPEPTPTKYGWEVNGRYMVSLDIYNNTPTIKIQRFVSIFLDNDIRLFLPKFGLFTTCNSKDALVYVDCHVMAVPSLSSYGYPRNHYIIFRDPGGTYDLIREADYSSSRADIIQSNITFNEENLISTLEILRSKVRASKRANYE